jgi:hypothetical protein
MENLCPKYVAKFVKIQQRVCVVWWEICMCVYRSTQHDATLYHEPINCSLFERVMLPGLHRQSAIAQIRRQLIDIYPMPRYTLLPKKVIQYLMSWPRHAENKKNENEPFIRYQPVLLRSFHTSGGQSPASYLVGPVSIPDQVTRYI